MNDETVLPCVDKLAFDTKRDAQTAVLVAFHQHGTKLKVYLCRFCKLWHLATDHQTGV